MWRLLTKYPRRVAGQQIPLFDFSPHTLLLTCKLKAGLSQQWKMQQQILTRAIVCSLKFGSFTACFKRCNTSGQEIVGMQTFWGGHIPARSAAFFNNVNLGEGWDLLTGSRSLEGMDPGIGRRQWQPTLQTTKSSNTIIQRHMINIGWYLSMRKCFQTQLSLKVMSSYSDMRKSKSWEVSMYCK